MSNAEFAKKVSFSVTSGKERTVWTMKEEYLKLVEDILEHDKFQELKKYAHHDSNIFDHVCSVSYLSFIISKKLKLNYKAAARGGLLHDFFFYDWRTEKPRYKNKARLHAFYHPHEALRNANAYFTLSDVEKDIIVKHMFPLTIALPRFKETIIVLLVDKMIASREFFRLFLKKRRLFRLKKNAAGTIRPQSINNL